MSPKVEMHPLKEIIARKLSGVLGVPRDEQRRMVIHAVDAAAEYHDNEIEKYRDALFAMVNQFSCYGVKDGVLQRNSGGLSTLEHAFEVLELSDPHPCPEHECDVDDCHEFARSGRPTSKGQLRLCASHDRIVAQNGVEFITVTSNLKGDTPK